MSQQHQKGKAAFFNFHINFTLFIILQFISQSKAGSTELDQIISVLLKTNMAVGGVTAAILDNLLPGSREERGLDAWKSTRNFDGNAGHVYDLPYIQDFLNRSRWVRYVPFLPYHGENNMVIQEDKEGQPPNYQSCSMELKPL